MGAQRCFKDANISFKNIAEECKGEVVGDKGDDKVNRGGWWDGNKGDNASLRSL
jgi:hypothetical protein